MMERDLGKHEAQIEALQAEVAELRADVKCIRDMLAEARGGWRMMMAVAGLAGIFGAAVSKLSSWVWVLPK